MSVVPAFETNAPSGDQRGATGTAPIGLRRNAAGFFLGLFYGGSLVNGIEHGLEYLAETQGRQEPILLADWPAVEWIVYISSGGAVGLLAAYCSRSMLVGLLASVALGALTTLVAFLGDTSLSPAAALIATAVGVAAAQYGRKLPLYAGDLATGRLFGVTWKHWLWLWLPWQYAVANAMWLGCPPSVLLGTDVGKLTLLREIVQAPIAIALLACGWCNAVGSLRADSQLTRRQAAFRFLGWWLLFPMFINVLRLLRFW